MWLDPFLSAQNATERFVLFSNNLNVNYLYIDIEISQPRTQALTFARLGTRLEISYGIRSEEISFFLKLSEKETNNIFSAR